MLLSMSVEIFCVSRETSRGRGVMALAWFGLARLFILESSLAAPGRKESRTDET